MLPHKMKISDKAFNALKRLQNNTGLTVNVGARLAFFASIERGYVWSGEEIELKQRELDKYTWLGDYGDLVEMLLKQKYPSLEVKDYYKAWGSHVDDGAFILESKISLSNLLG
ncbi:DNA sulfur modification protein DndE [Azotobacter salinestris]|uniref:DNA sulfur modification protein DndE n=1 Tax=Azotobacter salinestris TaxID=69964 RepID=UPI0032E00B15